LKARYENKHTFEVSLINSGATYIAPEIVN